jgi:hypothetical protein
MAKIQSFGQLWETFGHFWALVEKKQKAQLLERVDMFDLNKIGDGAFHSNLPLSISLKLAQA